MARRDRRRRDDPLTEIWERATSTQEPLAWDVGLALGVLALLVTWSPGGYRLVRHLVTLLHEAGHALVAGLAGRSVRGIRLHADTSGATLSQGREQGPGMVATLLAGYPAPALVGALGALLLGSGHAAAVLWALVLTCAILLVLVRNIFGLGLVAVIGAGVAALSWSAPAVVVTGAAYLVVWAVLLAAPRSVVELQRARRRGGRSTDADQLARLTGVPAAAWVGVFWFVCVSALALGGKLILV